MKLNVNANVDSGLFKTNQDIYSGLDTDYLPAGTNIGGGDVDGSGGSDSSADNGSEPEVKADPKRGSKDKKAGDKKAGKDDKKKKEKKAKGAVAAGETEGGGKTEEYGKKKKQAAERPRKIKKRRKKHYLLRLLLIAVFITGGISLIYSPIFAINEIYIKGNTLMTDEEILSATGIKEGDNIFVHTAGSIKEALSFNPYISDIIIDRSLPDVITVNIVERTPVIAVEYGGQYLILDKEGRVIQQEADKKTATLLTGLEITGFEQNNIPEFTDNELFTSTLSFINEVNRSGLFFKRLEASALVQKGYVTDTLIVQGEREFILENLDNIKAVLYDIDSKGIERGVISVNADDYATFSPVLE